MNLQEAFNKAYTGVMTHGLSKRRGGNHCFYRKDGTAGCAVRCGVGHLMPDDKYQKSFDQGNGSSASYLVESGQLRPEHLGLDANMSHSKYTSFVSALQAAHDSSADLLEFQANMKSMAAKFGLDIPKAG